MIDPKELSETFALDNLKAQTECEAGEKLAVSDHWATDKANPYFMESAPGAETVISGRKYLYFGGTGYFGLHGNAEMIMAGVHAFTMAGTHSATGKAFGNTRFLGEVERKLTDFFGTEDSVYYVSGILNGLFLAQSLASEYDVAFIDETSHYNIWDGIRTTGKPVFVYKHCNSEDLKTQLKTKLKAGQRPLVMTDGVFPALGEIAPVPELIKALEPYGGSLALDDAHAVGVLGKHGRGTFDYFGVSGGQLYFAGTLSKAFGGHGGFLPASTVLIKEIKENLGAYCGASSTPTPLAAASAKGIELVKDHPEWRSSLHENTVQLRAGIRALGFEVNETPFPIVAWSLKTADEMEKVQAALMDKGIVLPIIKHYSGVPENGLLRASIFSTHTTAQISRLLNELRKIV